jgi:hypothetical protein
MSTARFEYLELLRPLQRRIKNQRAEIRRLQAYELWYTKYVYGKQAPEPLIDKLRAFAQDILEGWPEVPQWDGLDLQEIATKHGLLESKTVTEACGEGCNCVEYDDFPMQCFRPSKLLKGDTSAAETSPAQCDHSWVTSNFEAPRCLWCHVEKSAAETREEL